MQISADSRRQAAYQCLLTKSQNAQLKLAELISIVEKLMRKAKLHPHFFANNTLYQNALHLALFALHLPYDYQNAAYLNQSLTAPQTHAILHLIEKRIAKRIPVEYITHEAEYLGHLFYVNEHVLVPRSIMHTRFQDFLNLTKWQNYRVLDLCTGSGCIGITLALLNDKIRVDLADISEEALKVADLNIAKYALENRVKTLHSDVFEQIQDKYDLIITNPPYVSARDYKKIPAEFKNEPKMALASGEDGLACIHKILTQAKQHLNPEGLLIAEVGYASAKLIKKRYKKLPLTWLGYRRPDGKESWFAMDGIFLCQAKALFSYFAPVDPLPTEG